MSDFKPSEKVVCINDSPGFITGIKNLVKDEIYEIYRVQTASNGRLEFAFIENGHLNGYWDASRFRKLDTNFANEVIKNIIQKELETSK